MGEYYGVYLTRTLLHWVCSGLVASEHHPTEAFPSSYRFPFLITRDFQGICFPDPSGSCPACGRDGTPSAPAGYHRPQHQHHPQAPACIPQPNPHPQPHVADLHTRGASSPAHNHTAKPLPTPSSCRRMEIYTSRKGCML